MNLCVNTSRYQRYGAVITTCWSCETNETSGQTQLTKEQGFVMNTATEYLLVWMWRCRKNGLNDTIFLSAFESENMTPLCAIFRRHVYQTEEMIEELLTLNVASWPLNLDEV